MEFQFTTSKKCGENFNNFWDYGDGNATKDKTYEQMYQSMCDTMNEYRMLLLNATILYHFSRHGTTPLKINPKNHSEFIFLFSEKYFEKTKKLLESNGFNMIQEDENFTITTTYKFQ